MPKTNKRVQKQTANKQTLDDIQIKTVKRAKRNGTIACALLLVFCFSLAMLRLFSLVEEKTNSKETVDLLKMSTAEKVFESDPLGIVALDNAFSFLNMNTTGTICTYTSSLKPSEAGPCFTEILTRRGWIVSAVSEPAFYSLTFSEESKTSTPRQLVVQIFPLRDGSSILLQFY